MVNPPQPPEVPKPHISDIGMAPQVLIPAFKHNLQSIQSIAQIFSPPSPSSCPAPSDFASPLLPTPKPSLPSSCRGSITSLSTQVVNSITLQTIFGKLAKWIENKTSNSVLIEGHQLTYLSIKLGILLMNQEQPDIGIPWGAFEVLSLSGQETSEFSAKLHLSSLAELPVEQAEFSLPDQHNNWLLS